MPSICNILLISTLLSGLNLGIRVSLQFYVFLCLSPLPGLFLFVFSLHSQHTLVLRKNVPSAVGTFHFVKYVSLLNIFIFLVYVLVLSHNFKNEIETFSIYEFIPCCSFSISYSINHFCW